MKIISLLILLFLSLTTSADEPPDWQAFLIHSDNKQWTAVVEPLGQDELPQKDKWQVSIFNQYFLSFPLPNQTAVWSTAFSPTGYPGGLLSDDGQVFAYVEYWYSTNKPVVTIYRKNCRVEKLGSSFHFSSILPRTESHQLWLHTAKTNRLVKKENKWLLEIFTIDANYLIPTECTPMEDKKITLKLDSASESVPKVK